MKIVNDTLKERGKWSMGRLSMLLILVSNVACSMYLTYTTNQLSDIPVNWAGTLLALWGINKTSTTMTDIKGVTNDVSNSVDSTKP